MDVGCERIGAGRLGEGAHVDDETIPDVAANEAIVGVIHVLNRGDFYVSAAFVLRAEVQHLLRFLNTTDQ